MYQKTGVTGVWLHGVLSELSPYPFDPARSVGYEARRANMKALIERCRKYGISLYLYLNDRDTGRTVDILTGDVRAFLNQK
jgi:hypothetical protein